MADNSIDGQILAEITALKTEQIASNRRLPNVMDELKKQNEETAKEVAANQEKTFIALREKIASNDPSNTEEELKKNLSALDTLKEEMEDTKSQSSLDAYKSQELLGKQLEAQKFAALSPAEQKEANEDSAAEDGKQSKFMKMISGGIGWLVESGKKVGKAAKLGAVAFLSTLAIGGLLIALGKFLQSDTFKDMTKFIQEEILPYLTEIGIAIASIVGAVAIAKFIAIAKKVRLAFLAVQTFMLGTMVPETGKMTGGVAGKFASIANKIKLAFIAVQTFMLQTMLPAVKGMIGGTLAKFASIANKIKLAFIAVQAFMLGTMLPSITAFMIPLLPFIAIAAAVALVLYGLWEAFQDFRKTLDETGSIGEAIKVAIGKFVGVLLGAIPALFLKLVAFVADLFGFKEFAKKIGDIDPIQFIADSVKKLIDTVVDFFKMLFDFDFSGFAKSLIPDFIKKAFGMGGSDESPEVASANRVKKLQQEKERLTERTKAKANTPRARQQARQAEILDQKIAREKASAAESLAKPMVLPKAKMSEAETLEAQRLKPSQYKESASIVEKMAKSKQQAELAKQQSTAAGPTNIVDARQSSSVTTTGSSGQSPIRNNKFGSLNKSAEAAGF